MMARPGAAVEDAGMTTAQTSDPVAPRDRHVGAQAMPAGIDLRPARYEIGATVTCSDGPGGELSRIVIDPITCSVTHLIVEPHHRHALARLVPVDLAESRKDDVQLRCTRAQLHDLQYAQETEFLPIDPWMAAYPGDDVLVWPYYAAAETAVVHERLPLGEVEIRRGEHIHACDGVIGRVHGLVVDPADQHLTHVLVEEGHLWAAKDVAIPVGALDRVDAEGVHVSLTKHVIADLPAIDLDPPVAR
jgi:hypothetical protein